MKKGRFSDEARQALLFTNYALFGNTTNHGSCSASYFLGNSNVSTPDISSKDIFEKFKKEGFYQKYKNEIDALEKEFNELSKTGNLIQIAIPETHLQKHLYLTKSGGQKEKRK